RALRSEKLDRGDVARIAAQIAFELVTKPDAASAQSATRIIKANLALITDPARQTSGIAALRAALDSELSGARAMFRGVQQRPTRPHDFDRSLAHSAKVAVACYDLPPEIAALDGGNQVAPRKPASEAELADFVTGTKDVLLKLRADRDPDGRSGLFFD